MQAHVVATRSFGRLEVEFVDRMLAAVRPVVNGTVLVSVIEGATIDIGYAVADVPQPLLFATFTIALALVQFGARLAFGLASLIRSALRISWLPPCCSPSVRS